MPTMTWPPVDSDRNRLIYVAVAVLAALATVYFLLWALQSRGLVPWAGFTLLLAVTLVAGTGRVLMVLARRRTTPGTEPDPVGPDPVEPDPAGSAQP